MTKRRLPPGEADDEIGGATAGLPVGPYDPLTPMGEMEQVGRLISGLGRQTAQRRAAARLFAAVVLLAVLAAIVFGVIRATHAFG